MFYYYSHLFQLTALWFYNSNCEPAWSEPSLPTRCLQSEVAGERERLPIMPRAALVLQDSFCIRITYKRIPESCRQMHSSYYELHSLHCTFVLGFWGWDRVTQSVRADIWFDRLHLHTWPLTSLSSFFSLPMHDYVVFRKFSQNDFFSLSVRSDLWPILGFVTHQLSTDGLDSLCCITGCVHNAILMHYLPCSVPVLFICYYFIIIY